MILLVLLGVAPYMVSLVLLDIAPYMHYWCYKALDSTWLYGATESPVAALGSARLFGAIIVES